LARSGGLLSGLVASNFAQSILLELVGYQEGWYREFAFFFVVPAIVFLLYVAVLATSTSKWRFVVVTALIVPVVVVYVFARSFFPITERFAWVEFTSFWTIVGQFAGVSLVGAWVVFWNAYDKTQQNTGNNASGSRIW
jgi:hypothetical protein